MTKADAIRAMSNGEKVTHNYFSSEEWVTEQNGRFLFEDDCKCEFNDFWIDHDGTTWQDGWSIFK